MKVKRLKNRSLAIESFRTGTKWRILESDHLGVADGEARRRASGRTSERQAANIERGKRQKGRLRKERGNSDGRNGERTVKVGKREIEEDGWDGL